MPEVFPEIRGAVMSKADQYREYAAACVRLARRTKDDNEKALLLQMAESWRRLADRAKQQDQK
jgi:hypothetical protein